MTPPAAATAAARRAVSAPARRVGPAPRPARRVSGPAHPAPSRPARPARPVALPRPARRGADATLGQRALEWLRALPDHRLLDRLIGGRIWIVLLGTLLVGIVTMQLSLLRMNASIGRAVEGASALEQRNAALRLSISQLSDSERIVAAATQMGFVMPPQGSPRFLTARAADPAKALTTMRVPDPTAAGVAAAPPAATTDTATDPSSTTTTGTTVTTTDPAATSTPATTTPSTTTPATGTVSPAASTTAPATAATPVTTAGGASAPVTGQG